VKTDLINKYRKAAQEFTVLESAEDKLLLYLSVSRFLAFTGGLALIWFVFSVSRLAAFLLIPTVIILFFWLLKLYSDHTRKKEFLGNLAKINRDEAAAVSGDYSHFEPGDAYINTDHDFSYDIDIFGKSSLFQYINRTVTGFGRDILAGWFSDPYKLSAHLPERQEAVRELTGKERWRHLFLASGMKTPLEKNQIKGLLDWMNECPDKKSPSIRKIFITILSGLAVSSFFLVLTGIIHYSVFVLFFLVNLGWIAISLKATNSIHAIVSKKYIYLSSLNELLKVFEKEHFESEVLNDIKLNISGRDISAAVSVRKLSRLIQYFDSRMNIMVGFFLNGLILWDFQCINRLEKWKSEYREFFPVWLGMIGKADAFISLGNFAGNNPEFIYPVMPGTSYVFSATGLGHPLIDEDKRICNDFVLDRAGKVCILTGANMAGKSTFLRTIAVNFILAMSGSPVCALRMDFMPVKLFTSMRTTDSLSHNESYFYAELKRLRTLKAKIESDEDIFFILDEILKGTNSTDKSLGSKLFLKKIISLGGTGLVATHDTSVGEMEKEFPESVMNMCFEIEIEGEIISFDYKLRKGITRKMNAALLMRQMGILD
jgi:hypothetical protein